jgi:hypothetical protein
VRLAAVHSFLPLRGCTAPGSTRASASASSAFRSSAAGPARSSTWSWRRSKRSCRHQSRQGNWPFRDYALIVTMFNTASACARSCRRSGERPPAHQAFSCSAAGQRQKDSHLSPLATNSWASSETCAPNWRSTLTLRTRSSEIATEHNSRASACPSRRPPFAGASRRPRHACSVRQTPG